MALYNNSTRVVGVADSGNETNLDTSTYTYDRVQLYIQISNGVTCDNLQFKPMIRKASITDNTFTPYNPIELCKIDNYQDYLYKSGDKWYKKQVIGKKILNGSENWQYNSVTQGSLFRSNNSITNAIIDNSYAPYCNYYTGIPLSQTRANGNIIINNSSTYSYVDIVDNRYSNATDFKTWLSSHNVILYYVLEIATDIEITDQTLINQLNNIDFNSYNPVTNISTDKGLMIIYAEALGNIN